MMPREKLIKYGVKNLEEYELLSIILGFGSNSENVFDLSKRILEELNSIRDLLDLSYEELTNIKGIKSAKATKIIASIELAKRIFSYKSEDVFLDNPKEIYRVFKYDFIGLKHEEFMVLFLDKRVRLIKKKMFSKGNNNLVLIDIKEIFNEAIKCSCCSLVLLHNHPSDYLVPSDSDINTTNRIISAGKLLEIDVLDHIIIGSNSYYSFLENDLIKGLK